MNSFRITIALTLLFPSASDLQFPVGVDFQFPFGQRTLFPPKRKNKNRT